ncbi:MAG TPA: hypothetical protein VK932_26875 [Kofleriaceae bacterium]|nr:hypothetical protein [Kofleriaceae bacterium]
MSFEKTWSGDWHGRVLERVHRRGFESVTHYVDQRPGVSLLMLAHEIGPDDVAAAQLRSILVQEAIRTRTVPRVLRDLFVRELRRSLPGGWKHPLDDASRSEVAGALATWQTELEVEDNLDCFDDESTFKAGQDLMDAEFPTGWLPEGPDDPVIVAFVDRCLGRAPS